MKTNIQKLKKQLEKQLEMNNADLRQLCLKNLSRTERGIIAQVANQIVIRNTEFTPSEKFSLIEYAEKASLTFQILPCNGEDLEEIYISYKNILIATLNFEWQRTAPSGRGGGWRGSLEYTINTFLLK